MAGKHDDWSVSGIGKNQDYTRQFVYKFARALKIGQISKNSGLIRSRIT